ncbi:hypothetical protein BDV18DRAFT_137524 [Aspergillus unguis]
MRRAIVRWPVILQGQFAFEVGDAFQCKILVLECFCCSLGRFWLFFHHVAVRIV